MRGWRGHVAGVRSELLLSASNQRPANSHAASLGMREAVVQTRTRQGDRFRGKRTHCNAEMTPRQIRESCPLDNAGLQLLKTSVKELGLSARAHDKVLRVSRTMADLEHTSEIQPAHLQEAVNYRLLDRSLWQ
jgi:magnesium chelatase family protein